MEENQFPQNEEMPEVTIIRRRPLPPDRREDLLRLLQIAFSETPEGQDQA